MTVPTTCQTIPFQRAPMLLPLYCVCCHFYLHQSRWNWFKITCVSWLDRLVSLKFNWLGVTLLLFPTLHISNNVEACKGNGKSNYHGSLNLGEFKSKGTEPAPKGLVNCNASDCPSPNIHPFPIGLKWLRAIKLWQGDHDITQSLKSRDLASFLLPTPNTHTLWFINIHTHVILWAICCRLMVNNPTIT